MSNVEAARNRMTRREARKFGATRKNVRRILWDMHVAGTLDVTDTEGTADLVCQQLVREAPEAFVAAGPGFDIDRLIEFLERILPLILQLLALFM